MAFADGSPHHHRYRATIAFHTFAKNGSNSFENLENITTQLVYNLVENLKSQVGSNKEKIDAKPQFASTVASIFVKYFTNMDVDPNDELFQNMVAAFDIIFQEINSACVGDVLPFLMPFINKSEYVELNRKVREFTDIRCFAPVKALRAGGEIQDENNNCGKAQPEKVPNVINDLLDLVDTDKEVTQEQASFVFEDMLGGIFIIIIMFVYMECIVIYIVFY